MLGKLIKNIRTKKHMTKTKIANEIGVDIGYLTHIENGDRKPKVDRHPAHGLEHYFLKKETLTLKRSVYCLLSGYRFFSNTNMNKKIFLFASRCT